MTSAAVPPSVSRTPLLLEAVDRATVCVLCSHNCGLRVDVSDGRIAAVRPDPTSPISGGYVCNKAYSIGHYVEHAQRTRHPLRRRKGGGFERIGWDEAIGEIAAKLSEIRAAHSPRAIGLVGIGGQGNHMDAPYGLTFLQALGSRRWFNALAQEKTQHFLVDHWMFDASPAVWFHPDIEHTRYLLALGTNPRISNRGHNPNDTFRRLAESPDVQLVVVDPRETETTRQADRHLRVRPGTDAYLLLGLVKAVVSGEGLLDADFVRERTRDFAVLQRALEDVDVAEMARRCGIEPEEIQDVARDFATAPSAAVMFDLAVEQTSFSTLVSYLIRALSLLTGNAGRPGGNVFLETFTPPARHPQRFGEPERALASGIRSIPAMGGFAMFSPTLIPEEIEVEHPERLRALIVEGANPVLSYSDAHAFRAAREKLDLLVVIDPAMTETAELADYVLPTPVGYEKWEIAGFPRAHPQVFVQLRPPLVPGPDDALPEPEIYTRLAEAMALVPEPPEELRALAAGALEPEGAAAWLARAQAASNGSSAALLFWGYRTIGAQLPSPALTAVWALCHENAFLRRASVLRTLGKDWRDASPFALAAELFRRILAHPEGVEVARADAEHILEQAVGWEDGRIRLAPEALVAELRRAVATAPVADPEFPDVLASGLRTRWTANTIQRNPAWRKGKGPHCALHLSPGHASRLGLEEGDAVRIVTRRGRAELPAAIDRRLQDGHVWIPNGFGVVYPKDGAGPPERQGINLNELSDAADRDPITGCPHHKATPCRIEAASAEGARSEA